MAPLLSSFQISILIKMTMVAVSGAGVFSGTRMEEDVVYVEIHGMTSLENTRLHLVIIFISNFLTET